MFIQPYDVLRAIADGDFDTQFPGCGLCLRRLIKIGYIRRTDDGKLLLTLAGRANL